MNRKEWIDSYIEQSREGFTNKLVRTIRFSLALQDELSQLDDTRLNEAKNIIFFALLGHFIHSQGSYKCTDKFQQALMALCEALNVRADKEDLTASIEAIIRNFTLEY
jgi:hypothetical protein